MSLPDPGVRVTHIPSGLAAECSFERSQSKNRKIAEQMLEYGLVCLSVNS